MTGEVKKSLQEIINIIVGTYDPDAEDPTYRAWEIVDMLRPFADKDKIHEIWGRQRQDVVIAPKWNVGDEVQLQRRWKLSTYPDDLRVETTYEHREKIHTVKIEHYFWVNLLDNPWSESNYVGWKYVVRFIDDSMPGQYLVSENSLFISEE